MTSLAQTHSGAISIFILLVVSKTASQEPTGLEDVFKPITKAFQIHIGHLFQLKGDSEFDGSILEILHKAAKKLPYTTPFPCDLKSIMARSDLVPNSVHKLRPGDIDVIGALGDSLSAGTGISAITLIEEAFIAQRGRTWSGGGEKNWRNYLTVPNILKEFNPNLIGYALKASQSSEWVSQFNVAENGATSSQMPHMVKELVRRIKNDARVDFEKDWKMVTLMIGDNDFCLEVCKLENYNDALEKHREDLIEVLRYLKDNLPRTLVNVVPPPRLDVLFEMENLPLKCFVVQNAVCPCLRSLKYINEREQISWLMRKWQDVDIHVSLMSDWEANDFAVVIQPFTLNYTFPKTPSGELDFGYLAPDCFHLSEKGQARFANDFWNSLLEPIGKKSIDGNEVFSKFLCPSEEHPYIFTTKNSH